MVARPDPVRTVGTFTGRHVLAEISGVLPSVLDDTELLGAALRGTLERAGAIVCDVMSKRFSPQGVTVLALLCESHASVHTYPELGSAFLDVFTCGDSADPELAVTLLAEELGAGRTQSRTVHRGDDLVTADTGKD